MKVDLNKLSKAIEDSTVTIEKHPTEDIYIYGYYKHPLSKAKSIWNNYSVMCRGLILDKEGNIVERAFDKFWTFRNHITEDMVLLSENRIAKLPKSKPKIYEKLDGTMGILYWVNNTPYIATQRSFSSLKAIKGSEILQNKYMDETLRLDRRFSYVFEVMYPETSLVVNYSDMEDLILIGVIDKETGKSLPNISNLGFKTKRDLTKEFGQFNSLTQIEEANKENLEGVVLEYDTGLRIKIKFPWYKDVHKELQSIFNADYQLTASINKLKDFFYSEKKVLCSSMIADAIKSGDDNLSDFLNKLNIDQIDRGALRWVERHKSFFLENNYIDNEFFRDSIEFDSTPDDRIWDWKRRYLDKYYD